MAGRVASFLTRFLSSLWAYRDQAVEEDRPGGENGRMANERCVVALNSGWGPSVLLCRSSRRGRRWSSRCRFSGHAEFAGWDNVGGVLLLRFF